MKRKVFDGLIYNDIGYTCGIASHHIVGSLTHNEKKKKKCKWNRNLKWIIDV